MMVLQTSPLPLGYHTKNVCLIYRRYRLLSIGTSKHKENNMCRKIKHKKAKNGKAYRAAGEPVFGVNNPAVFLRKILRLFSMAKRQNFSRQPYRLSRSSSFSIRYFRLLSNVNYY